MFSAGAEKRAAKRTTTMMTTAMIVVMVVVVMMKKNEKRETIIETRDQKLSVFIIRESLKEGFYRMGKTRFRSSALLSK